MSDSKNMVLAMVLAMAILIGWDILVVRPKHQAEQARQAALSVAAPSPAPVSTPSGAAPVSGHAPLEAATVAVPVTRAVALASGPRVAIVTPNLVGSIDLVGARLNDIVLKKYHQNVDKKSDNIVLFSPSNTPNPYFAAFGWAGADVPTAQTLWSASGKTLTPETPVTLSWRNKAGLTFVLRFGIDSQYMLTVTQTVANKSGAPVTLTPYGLLSRGEPHAGTGGNYVLHEGPLGVFAERLQEVKYDDLRDGDVAKVSAAGGWLGFTDKYWLAALIPAKETHYDATFQRTPAGRYQADYLAKPLTIAPGMVGTQTVRLFAGAKEVTLLDAYAKKYDIPLFDRAIDWGWFYFLTRPIFFLLHWIYQIVGNFGLAIIGLTIIIKGIMFPLANKSYVSMNKMKEMGPKIKELQERFKDNREGLNKAMVEIYQKEKVNPVGGCLPMLLQIPVFFALYKVLFVTIEMRHQPFYGWIRDLSAADPLTPVNLFGLLPFTPPAMLAIGVLPLVMGVTMWLQQRLNPAPTDPVQAKIFQFLPVIFTVMLAPFAAGLVLYWTVNNLLSIAQQKWLLTRHASATATPVTPVKPA